MTLVTSIITNQAKDQASLPWDADRRSIFDSLLDHAPCRTRHPAGRITACAHCRANQKARRDRSRRIRPVPATHPLTPFSIGVACRHPESSSIAWIPVRLAMQRVAPLRIESPRISRGPLGNIDPTASPFTIDLLIAVPSRTASMHVKSSRLARKECPDAVSIVPGPWDGGRDTILFDGAHSDVVA